MSKNTAILEPSLDGMLHLAMPRELLGKKVRVTAQAAEDESAAATSDGWAALSRIMARGGFADIPDPAAWQRELRKDRSLPGRDDP